MNAGCFYDTWAFLALGNRADAGHTVAVEADTALEEGGFVAVTSDWVLDETVTGLHAAAGAVAAGKFIDYVSAATAAEALLLVEIHRERRQKALALFRRLAPETPRLSLTDCASFAVMHELGIAAAFTADRHFHRAGRGVRPIIARDGAAHALRMPER